MSGGAALVMALVLAVVIVGAFSKPGRTMVGGFITRAKDGSYVMKLTPAKRKKGKRKKGKGRK